MLSASEQSNILGIHEFEESLKLIHQKRYLEAENYLKQAMKILKQAQQERSLGYLYLLKRLGWLSMKNSKFSESEKYFKIASDMMPQVTSNPLNHFSTKKNLLLFYIITNLERAEAYGDELMGKKEEMLPSQQKELTYLMGNVYLLKGQY